MPNRIELLAACLPDDVGAMLVQSKVNRVYLTGMQSSAGTLLITRDESYFIIDFRYIELARRLVKNARVILQQNLHEQVLELLNKHGIKRLGLESAHLTVAGYLELQNSLCGVELVFDNRCNDALIKMRRVKGADEIARIGEAQDVCDKVFGDMLNFIKAGLTEKEVALEIYRLGYLYGADGLSFPSIVVSGVNSSMPHGVPTDKPIENGDLLTMDFGYMMGGYCSDMTRTVAVGEINDKQRLIYDTTLKAQLAALAAIAPGKVCGDIDKAARDIIYAAGFEGCFGHGLGHSIGVEVHEGPRFRVGDSDLVMPGNVISVEPGIYLEGEFGCRIEDLVAITDDGYINLTHSPKELIIL